MAKKLYYRATGTTAFKWVDSMDEATADPTKESAEATMKRFSGAELVEKPSDSQHPSPFWVVSRDFLSEDKLKTAHEAAEHIRQKFAAARIPEPFISWVTDDKGGVLILDGPALSDTSGLWIRPFSWDSNHFNVTVFSIERKFPITAVIDF
jgi:hypothetical protein